MSDIYLKMARQGGLDLFAKMMKIIWGPVETEPDQGEIPVNKRDTGPLHYLEQSDPGYFRQEVDRKEFDPGKFQRDEWYEPPEWEDEINIPAFLRRLPDQGKKGGQARRRYTHLPGGR